MEEHLIINNWSFFSELNLKKQNGLMVSLLNGEHIFVEIFAATGKAHFQLSLV